MISGVNEEGVAMAQEMALDTATTLATIWNEVLQRSDSISGTDRFFGLGGDSAAMMMMLFRVEQVLHVEITPDQVFQDDSFAAMVGNIGALQASSDGSLSVINDRAC
jgi:acyl carrier protein